MTIVLGMQALDGALLIADCMAVNHEETYYIRKIEQGLYDPEEEKEGKEEKDEEGVARRFSGVYAGKAGSYHHMDIGSLAIRAFSKEPNLADLFKDRFILENDLGSINVKMDLLEQACRQSFSLRDQEKMKKYERLKEEIDRMELKREIRSFIESTVQSPLFSISRLALRISANYVPDLLIVKNAQVTLVGTYAAIGTGAQVAAPLLQERYSRLRTLDEALPIGVDVFNKVLEDKDNFRGYQLVSVRRNKDGIGGIGGIDEIKTAIIPEAERLDVGTISYLDPWFHPIKL